MTNDAAPTPSPIPDGTTVDVVGVGNAIVDVIARAPDEFLEDQGLVKNSMNLIDEARAHELYDLMGPAIEASGGSAANTAAGVASLGGTAAYIGKVSDDVLGTVFGHDMRAAGVAYDVPPATEGPATARSLILVTPDAQRTMNTFLGISQLLVPEDISRVTVERGRLLFCEGYLWDAESAKQAIRLAMDLAHAAGRRTALTLSDLFCVERHRAEFRELVQTKLDVLFANQVELRGLYELDDLDAAVEAMRAEVDLAFVTIGKKGSLVVTPDEIVEIEAAEIGPVVDTTGAGDQYAAGALFGVAHGLDLARCGELGSLAAAEVISHVGPRPERNLADLARAHDLL